MSTDPAVPAASHKARPRVASRAEWLQERLTLLAEEKELTRRMDALAAKVRTLPWVRVDSAYVFDTPSGTASLADLFGTASQLVVYHFMYDPTWSQGCKSCTFVAEHYERLAVHLAHRDITLMTVSRASLAQIEAYKQRMGFTFPWVSDPSGRFGRDFEVSYSDEELASGKATYNFLKIARGIRELPGLSVFAKCPDGVVHHTYSTYARGLEAFLTAYRYMDITPKGRDEQATGGMGWLRHRDRYEGPAYPHPWEERPGITAPRTT